MDGYLDDLLNAVNAWGRDVMRNNDSLSASELKLFNAYIAYKNKELKKVPENVKKITLIQQFEKAITVPAPRDDEELVLDLISKK